MINNVDAKLGPSVGSQENRVEAVGSVQDNHIYRALPTGRVSHIIYSTVLFTYVR